MKQKHAPFHCKVELGCAAAEDAWKGLMCFSRVVGNSVEPRNSVSSPAAVAQCGCCLPCAWWPACSLPSDLGVAGHQTHPESALRAAFVREGWMPSPSAPSVRKLAALIVSEGSWRWPHWNFSPTPESDTRSFHPFLEALHGFVSSIYGVLGFSFLTSL